MRYQHRSTLHQVCINTNNALYIISDLHTTGLFLHTHVVWPLRYQPPWYLPGNVLISQSSQTAVGRPLLHPRWPGGAIPKRAKSSPSYFDITRLQPRRRKRTKLTNMFFAESTTYHPTSGYHPDYFIKPTISIIQGFF